jgi:hypothetical protein
MSHSPSSSKDENPPQSEQGKGPRHPGPATVDKFSVRAGSGPGSFSPRLSVFSGATAVEDNSSTSRLHHSKSSLEDDLFFSGSDFDEDDPMSRPGLLRPTDGRSQVPLLHENGTPRHSYDKPTRPPRPLTRSSSMRSRDPATNARLATRKKYTYAAFFLGLSLVSFVVQTETAYYVQHTLKWKKAYCML